MAQAWDFKLTPIKYRAIENVVYGQKDGLALTYDVLIPETKPKNRGVLLIVSGSWKSRKFNTPRRRRETAWPATNTWRNSGRRCSPTCSARSRDLEAAVAGDLADLQRQAGRAAAIADSRRC
jgi:hypothetical protein